ncbi:MAG: hypothetical protein A2904_01645 [Candidatus Staskawiczbacteria bacterium RIFCSPLOWO2_01_FULL_33_9]|uniref:Type II secretion system protein J n=1 Tax=Candidatus Staskawiczbacteria bacterium RIFCSPLOWO2_01_FULL_33_9 TaxID=1802211 RepID=A0A1G2I769_9BACT|nr:MAG: hypothetical protein A2904_01645 [Candidatus Staskawiczbacteria bacterium RIFCSPLOWO2_01_FULL_33_9]
MKLSKGFTLIELIVVMALLLFVVGSAVIIFTSISQHQRIILSEQELLNQTSYALERMSKSLRVAKRDLTGDCLQDSFGTKYPGYNYLFTHPTIDGFYTGVKFINQSDNDVCQEFYLDNDDILNPVLKEVKSNGDSIAITSDKFMINSLRFSINGEDGSVNGPIGAGGSNGIQPRITIFLEIQTKGDINPSIKKIQTTVSQRDLNE